MMMISNRVLSAHNLSVSGDLIIERIFKLILSCRTIKSLLSLLVLLCFHGFAIQIAAQPLVLTMPTGNTTASANTCVATFVDDGGEGGNYANGNSSQYIICPNFVGRRIQVSFESFRMGGAFDSLVIADRNAYSGNPMTEPNLVGVFLEANNPGTITSTHSSGCLTFYNSTDASITDEGWQASIACVPAAPDLNVACADDVPDPPILTRTCFGETTTGTLATAITPGNCPNDFTMVRTWTFFDTCGMDQVSQTITVLDTLAPVPPSVPADLNLACASAVPPPVTLTANDNCDGDITVSPSATIFLGGCLNDYRMVRTWTFTDTCGNTSSVSQTINVLDTLAPVIQGPIPSDLNLSCAADVPPPVQLTANDNCNGDITVSPSATIFLGGCLNDFTMVRTWTFSDTCGNTSSVSQTIVVLDTIAPVLLDPVPEDIDLMCSTDVPPPVNLRAMDNCRSTPTSISPTEQVAPGRCDNEYTLVRTWTFTDTCGNASSVSQTIGVLFDTISPTPPVVTPVINVQCADDILPQDLTAQDDCMPITVSPVDVVTPGSCDNEFTVDRTWTFVDLCGNASSVSQTINVKDTIAPVLTCPETQTITLLPGECDYVYEFDVTALDNCDDDPDISQMEGPASGAILEKETTTLFKFVGTDECGNSDDCSWEITILEFPDPTQALFCDDEIHASMGSDCSIELIAELFFEGGPYGCFEDYMVLVDGIEKRSLTETGVYNVMVLDPDNNNLCNSRIIVEDKLGPIIDAPDMMVDCGTDVTAIEGVNYNIDDCTYYTHHISDVLKGDLCDGDRRIERTITATDDLGNTSVHVQTITFKPLDLGLIVGPNPIVTTTCGVVSMPAIYTYTGDIMDAYPTFDGNPLIPGEYCNFLVTKKDEIVEACDLSCTNSMKVIRRWSIYDWCNIESEPRRFEQLISAKDLEAPVIDPFTEIDTFSVDPWMCVIENLPLPAADYIELCTPDYVTIEIHSLTGIEVIDGVAKDVPVGTHEFAYYAIDCCGNISLSEIATVEVIDEVIPVAIAKQEIVVSLTYDPEEEEGIAKLYAASVDNGSYDNCSEVTLRVKRDSDPCRADSDEYGPFVKFCCRDVGKTLQVWLEVRDTSGNYNETWANVLIEDKFAVIECTDVYIDCYEDIEKTISDNRPDAYGTCRSKSVEEISRDESNYNELCNSGVIYVTWGVRDLNHIRCVQAIYVNYQTSLVCNDINWPESFTEVNCVDDIPTPNLTWDADPCDLIGWSYRSDTFIFGPDADACRKIVNEYTVIDWCKFDDYYGYDLAYGNGYQGNYFEFEGGTDIYDGVLCADPNYPYYNEDLSSSENGVYKYIEIIKVIDDIPPVIEETDETMYTVGADCYTTIQIVNSASDDGCQGGLYWEVTVDWDGDGNFREEYTYTRDRFGSKLTGTELDFVLYYDDVSGNPEIYIDGPMRSFDVEYKVFDGCGNIDKEVSTIMIVDKKDPTPYCIHLSTAVMESGSVELWAVDFDQGSFDNCDSRLYFTFDEEHPVLNTDPKVNDPFKVVGRWPYFHYFKGAGEEATEAEYLAGNAQKWYDYGRNYDLGYYTYSSASLFICDDLGVTDVRMTVWDEKLNSDWCSVELTLIDNQDVCGEQVARASVEGNVSTEENKDVSEVEVTIEDITNAEYELKMMTGNDGNFAFANNPMYTDYYISALKDGADMEGVSTLDLVLIQRHILGIDEFESPYKVIAGDINSDKKVTGTDLVVLRKTILGIYKEFPTNNSWRFYDRSQVLTVENALDDCREVLQISDLNKNMYGQNFIAVKVGDVNATARTNGRDLGIQTRSAGTVTLELSEQNVRKGDLVELTFSSKDFNEVYGYQFTIELDGLTLEAVAEGSAIMTDANIGVLDNNTLTVSYSDISGLNASDNMFTLTVKATKDGAISNMIALTNTALNSEAYIGTALDINTVELAVNGSEANSFRLDQNMPNPFDETTVIGFVLPEAGNATLSVYNVAGIMIRSVNNTFTQGYNEVKFTKEELNTTGVLYYTLKSGDYIDVKKMIVLEK